ncbi:MAG: hypothetical protein AABZ47_10865, partial [Planctomycetota bacterium]
VIAVFLVGAVYAFRVGRRALAMISIAVVTALGFQAAWYGFGHAIDNVDKVAKLASALDAGGVPKTAHVYWADRRPDARLSFYFNRRSEHMVDPEEIVTKGILDRRADKHLLERMAIERALEYLRGRETIYLLMRRKSYDRLGESLLQTSSILGTVSMEEVPSKDDWLIVTNAKHVTGVESWNTAELETAASK